MKKIQKYAVNKMQKYAEIYRNKHKYQESSRDKAGNKAEE